ncbi:MAG: hypothetical protein LQ343_007746 [Gyalolechia ehrenbergii]|nr:MAG: hypothetical protein LQ343_007746 [Gyalolechia ehrenbergii]
MASTTTPPTANPTATTFTDSNGNIIETYTPTANHATSNPSMDAPSLLPTPNPSDDYDPTPTDPFSPFYSHARASESSRRLHPIPSNANEKDLEKGITIHTNPVRSTQSLPSHPNNTHKPSLLCKSEARNQRRGCFPNLTKKQRIAVHMLIALLFVGAVTGLGVGVSKAMGTGIWKGENAASAGIGED